jgi:Amt family ammonium transporter
MGNSFIGLDFPIGLMSIINFSYSKSWGTILPAVLTTLRCVMNSPVVNTAVSIDTVWVLLCAFLVFFMNTGFGCIEAGFCRSKNSVNILAKNFVVFGIASLGFWALGFGFMFGDGNDLIGLSGWFLKGADNSPALNESYAGVFSSLNWTGIPLSAKFFFQLAFAATAATIVSGCVAERIHYTSFLIFAFVIATFIYPICGHWVWGGGWLSSIGFWDFAGSTVVHSVGGWAGLAGILVLGPRIGKYRKDGSTSPILGHNMGLVFLGGMILWLGWFGFNPGSTMGVFSDSGLAASHIVVVTNLACVSGLLVATLVSHLESGKPDFSMTVNGALAGLVGITAPCAFVSNESAVIIGAIAGAIVVYAVKFFDYIRIDDPVGALSVHLVCGIWGTLSLGLFAETSMPGGIDVNGLFFGGGATLLSAQAIGVAAVGAATFSVSYACWSALRATLSIRVVPHVEADGLDIHEMGMEAYPREASIDVVNLIKQSLLGKHGPELLKLEESINGNGTVKHSAEQVYTIGLQHVTLDTFMLKWNDLSSGQGKDSIDFTDVYKHFARIKDGKLRFRGGQPEIIREKVQALAKTISADAKAFLAYSHDLEPEMTKGQVFPVSA